MDKTSYFKTSLWDILWIMEKRIPDENDIITALFHLFQKIVENVIYNKHTVEVQYMRYTFTEITLKSHETEQTF